MANEFLIEGAISLATANWRLLDGTGGAGFATNATLYVNKGAALITDDVDQSAVGTGVSLFQVEPQFFGQLGTPAAPLRFDVDGTGTPAFNYNAGGGRCYFRAGGNGSVATSINVASRGAFYLTEGTATTVRVAQGYFEAMAASLVPTAILEGGSSVINYNATAGTTLNVYGGTHTVKRAYATINCYGGTLIYDVNTAETATDAINIFAGGSMRLISMGAGSTPNLTLGGALDVSGLKVPVTLATGLFEMRGVVVGDNKNLTITTRSYRGLSVLP